MNTVIKIKRNVRWRTFATLENGLEAVRIAKRLQNMKFNVKLIGGDGQEFTGILKSLKRKQKKKA